MAEQMATGAPDVEYRTQFRLPSRVKPGADGNWSPRRLSMRSGRRMYRWLKREYTEGRLRA